MNLMETLLKIVFFIFLLSFIGRLFFRYVLPWWLKRFVKKQEKKYNDYYSDSNSHKEGDIGISKETEESIVNPDVGEYIDYEEIDDKNDNNKS